MTTRVISETDYIELYTELQALVRAWKDRLDVSEYDVTCVLLQVGGTLAAWSDAPLAQTLDYVKRAWETAHEVPWVQSNPTSAPPRTALQGSAVTPRSEQHAIYPSPTRDGDVTTQTAIPITDDQIRDGYRRGIISYDLLEFATFPAWRAGADHYRARCAEILAKHEDHRMTIPTPRKHQRKIRIAVVLPVTVDLIVGTDADPNTDSDQWEILSVQATHCATTPRLVEESMQDEDFTALGAAAARAQDEQ